MTQKNKEDKAPISLSEYRAEKEKKQFIKEFAEDNDISEKDAFDIFKEALKRNAEERKRKQKEREKTNERTLRSYGIRKPPKKDS